MEAFACEYVGRELEVSEASNHLYDGIRGTILDETKNTFLVRCKNRDLRIPKRGNRFFISTQTERFDVAGNLILYTVEDRIHNASKIARTAKRMRH